MIDQICTNLSAFFKLKTYLPFSKSRLAKHWQVEVLSFSQTVNNYIIEMDEW